MTVNTKLYVGAASVAITPTLGTTLGVDFLAHYARFIHDPVYSKAIVFRQNNLFVAIVIVDICIMDTDYMDEIKLKIHNETKIEPHNILLACNHNHATGAVVSLLGGSADLAYRKKLPAWIISSVKKAFENLKPAQIAYGSFDESEFVVCRRYVMEQSFEAKNPVTRGLDQVKTNPFGAENKIIKATAIPDPELSFLAIKDLNDQWIAILGNYSLHYAADWPGNTVTGDYFGQFASKLTSLLNVNDHFVGIMSNGTSGDINIWDFRNPDRLTNEDFQKSKLIGEALADKLVATLPDVEWLSDATLNILFETKTVTARKPSPEELEIATKAFIENDFDNLSLKPDFVQRIYDREQILLNEYPDYMEIPIQAIKIGKLIIGALPGEFFAETGLKLKKEVKNNPYFSICLANAYGGYVPPAHEIEKGGYETWRARSSFLAPDSEAIIREGLLEMIQKF